MLKLHHLLEQEADELKRLLGAKVGGSGGDQPDGANENATRATLARLKKDLASRRLHEATASASEVCVYRSRGLHAIVQYSLQCPRVVNMCKRLLKHVLHFSERYFRLIVCV